MLDEILISKGIIDSYRDKLVGILDADVAICGAGPSGLVCAATLACAGKKVVVFEKKLSIGGGMWGGGMMFNQIVVQEKAKNILDDYSIRTKKYHENYYVADAVECVCSLGYHAVNKGAVIINGVYAEDVMIRENKICGLVINWSAAQIANLHVDPLTMRAGYIVDSTGHPCEVVGVVERKSGIRLNTETGKISGEKSMWADVAESMVESNTREICPGLYVCGMSANSVYGSPRMGPIFGGMLLSGRKLAEELIEKLNAG